MNAPWLDMHLADVRCLSPKFCISAVTSKRATAQVNVPVKERQTYLHFRAPSSPLQVLVHRAFSFRYSSQIPPQFPIRALHLQSLLDKKQPPPLRPPNQPNPRNQVPPFNSSGGTGEGSGVGSHNQKCSTLPSRDSRHTRISGSPVHTPFLPSFHRSFPSLPSSTNLFAASALQGFAP
ncbi:hypothetical protein BT96DRAFT_1015020 [Gymnopus androsaceus JB14]|uniref:Uncharacterized protein n=1 Tax=Gymnopus androsaceus JB14 TaxID=1447944 RepID=A0A6A4I6B2_9AGAR|nr:hypothetical protein BT96DRAFT_1015020 [Gymnopus androsaceus JB14]